MSCCRKSKRPKREEPLKLAVRLEQQSESLLEGPATSDENGLQIEEKKTALLNTFEIARDNIERFLGVSNSEFDSLRNDMQKMKEILLDCQEDFKEKLVTTIKDGKSQETEHTITPKYLECILKKRFEEALMKTIKKESDFEQIEKIITPKALANCECSTLLMAMKVSFELRRLADKKGANEEKLNDLANSVEAFICALLDPLKTRKQFRETFGIVILDDIIDDAIDLDQKKFFAHPAVEDEIERKFHGRGTEKSGWIWWQLLLFRFFCFFDLLISPMLFIVYSLLKKRTQSGKEGETEETNEGEKVHSTVENMCQMYSSPHAKYVRDTLSYTVLVVLHYALCLSPSTIAFSRLEWVVLVFFAGRYLIESQQIWNIMQRVKLRRKSGDVGIQWKGIRLKTLSLYLSDSWNLLDFIILLVYLVVAILRVTTWHTSGSVIDNRTLAIAGYFYSFISLCLTLRLFGYVAEQSRHLGVIQIALFGILKDISTIVLQFVAGILAFSIAITKVYMAEKYFVGNIKNDIACANSGISCWWAMVTHLGWSLLGTSDESDPMTSVDAPSETIARIFYAAFLIFAVILLLNMLIALLCNTYQQTVDNSLKVWSIKRAVTIQTYDAYDPVPVPLNIIYNIGKLIGKLMRRKDKNEATETEKYRYRSITQHLERRYFFYHGDVFPVTDEDKIERVLHEQNKNREDHQQHLEQVQQMVSQVLCTSFIPHGSYHELLPVGPEMWEVHQHIQVDGHQLTCVGEVDGGTPGARYLKPFSVEFPCLEVVILETGEEGWLGIGVVNEEYGTDDMPGMFDREAGESVGYVTTDGRISHGAYNTKATKGPAIARRGDRICCTVAFDNEKIIDGKKQVPVSFSLNGKKIIAEDGEDHFFVDSYKSLYPYVSMSDGCRALAKMCPGVVRTLPDNVTEMLKAMWARLERTDQKIDTLLARLTDSKGGGQNANQFYF